MISAVVLTKNEEENIEECLQALAFCDEILIIDDGSTDDTKKLASKYGKVRERSLDGNFANQLNFGLQEVKGEWVLFVDPDERVTEELRNEIIREIDKNNKHIKAFSFRRLDYFGTRWLKYGEVGAFVSIRLVKKGSGNWKRRVHQYFKTRGSVKELKNPLLHYPHQTLRKFIANINQWSTLHAIANKEEGKRSNTFKIIVWPIGHFFSNYLLRGGFLDGTEGFIYASLMAFHSYLSWSKLWMLQKGFSKI